MHRRGGGGLCYLFFAKVTLFVAPHHFAATRRQAVLVERQLEAERAAVVAERAHMAAEEAHQRRVAEERQRLWTASYDAWREEERRRERAAQAAMEHADAEAAARVAWLAQLVRDRKHAAMERVQMEAEDALSRSIAINVTLAAHSAKLGAMFKEAAQVAETERGETLGAIRAIGQAASALNLTLRGRAAEADRRAKEVAAVEVRKSPAQRAAERLEAKRAARAAELRHRRIAGAAARPTPEQVAQRAAEHACNVAMEVEDRRSNALMQQRWLRLQYHLGHQAASVDGLPVTSSLHVATSTDAASPLRGTKRPPTAGSLKAVAADDASVKALVTDVVRRARLVMATATATEGSVGAAYTGRKAQLGARSGTHTPKKASSDANHVPMVLFAAAAPVPSAGLTRDGTAATAAASDGAYVAHGASPGTQTTADSARRQRQLRAAAAAARSQRAEAQRTLAEQRSRYIQDTATAEEAPTSARSDKKRRDGNGGASASRSAVSPVANVAHAVGVEVRVPWACHGSNGTRTSLDLWVVWCA